MADEFNIAQDIKIELSLPNGTNGIWNFSEWDDGSNWGSSSSLAWVDIVAVVSRAEISLGSSVENGFYAPATPNQMNIQFQSEVFDPANNKYIRPNVPIKFSYRANPDTAPSTWTVLFTGFIDTFDTSYDAFGNNLVNVIASSSLKRGLAKNLASFVVTAGMSDFTFWTNWAAASGMTIAATWVEGTVMATETFTNVSSGEVLDALMQVENGFLVQDNTDGLTIYSSVATRTIGVKTYTFSNTHSTASSHICISNVDVSYNLDDSFNSYYVDSITDGIIQTAVNQDLVDLYGEIRCEKTLHLAPASIIDWLNNTTPKNPGLKVNSIETPAIKRDGKLAHVFYPGEYVGIDLVQTGYTIAEDDWITKATHLIDPDNWFTTLELWKGF